MATIDQNTYIAGHIRRLKLSSADEYLNWCKKNGYLSSLDKRVNVLKAEYQDYHTKIFTASLKKSNSISFEKGIEQIRALNYDARKHYNSQSSDRMHLGDTLNSILDLVLSSRAEQKNTFLDLALYLYRNTKLFDTKKYVDGINQIVHWKVFWIRDYTDWKPKSHNPDRQFGSLIRHIFCKYPVPSFLDKAWLEMANHGYIEWFLHIAEGNNIRTLKTLPFPITKMQAHHFLDTPDSWELPKALLYGQVIAAGGTPRLAEALRKTQISAMGTCIVGRQEFVLSVINFFIKNPMFDLNQIGPAVDYIWNQKYISQHVIVERGQPQQILPPPQPNFSMTGRSPNALLAQVERWHRQLGKETKGGNLQWNRCPIKEFQLVEGAGPKSKTWRIIELLSSKELADEGRAMHHCVASYAQSCARGSITIWSLRMNDHTGNWRLLTIEVSNKAVVQVRGPYNRMSTQQEHSIISRWAQKEGIKVAYK